MYYGILEYSLKIFLAIIFFQRSLIQQFLIIKKNWLLPGLMQYLWLMISL